jgi:20S proteasome subunit beta 6
LYGKRFFPYYTFNLLVGLDSNGQPQVYGYDAIGSYDKAPYGCQGSGKSLMMGVLDNQFQRKFSFSSLIFLEYNNIHKKIPTKQEEVQTILVDAFQSAAERDIYTGDNCEVLVLRLGKEPESSSFKLRYD